MSVLNQKEVPITSLRLVMPSGLQEVSPTVKSGWTINEQKSGDDVTKISWTGGEITVGERDDFTFSAQVPAKTGALDWKAYQSYADSTTVSWDETPSGSNDATGNVGPYSVTSVSDNLATAAVMTKKINDEHDKTNWVLGLSIAAGTTLVLKGTRPRP